jgi:hypothetical protein
VVEEGRVNEGEGWVEVVEEGKGAEREEEPMAVELGSLEGAVEVEDEAEEPRKERDCDMGRCLQAPRLSRHALALAHWHHVALSYRDDIPLHSCWHMHR